MTAYLEHRPDPDDKWGTACGAPWQYWQAAAMGITGLALQGVTILPPHPDPRAGDEIRTCPACVRAQPVRVYQPRPREERES